MMVKDRQNQLPLAGLRVLITRPAGQNEGLQQAIETLGGCVTQLPLIQIDPLTPSASILAQWMQSMPIDGFIFTSRNAVIHGHHYLSQFLPKEGVVSPLFAVGPGTKQELEGQGYASVIMPTQDYSSEGLLQLPALQQLQDKTIMIVTGSGGRTLLPSVLQQRGARVLTLAVYQRCCPQLSAEQVHGINTGDAYDVTVLTSLEGLSNLLKIFGNEGLFQGPLLVISDRMVAGLKQYGYHGAIIQAPNATEQGIVDSLIQWQERVDNE